MLYSVTIYLVDTLCHLIVLCSIFFFFFKQKTAYEMRISDWSSDVCSSDLFCAQPLLKRGAPCLEQAAEQRGGQPDRVHSGDFRAAGLRSVKAGLSRL